MVDQLLVDQLLVDQQLVDELLVDELLVDELLVDVQLVDQLLDEELLVDEMLVDALLVDELLVDQQQVEQQRVDEMVVDELPQVSYKIVNMADVVKHGVDKARCLKEGEGEGILGGKTGGGTFMEFDEDLQVYKTTFLDLMKHGVTDEDAAHLGRLLAEDDKFTKFA